MAFEVRLPDIGEGIAEGEIVRWLVQAGDAVREDQPLVEVMTDKASVEIPSPRTGTVEALHAEEGAMLPVGAVLVTIAVAGGERAAGAAHAAPPAQAAPAPTAPAAAPAAGGARASASPAVRALAKSLGIALEALAGSGPGGAITADDVKRAAAAAAPVTPASADEERVPLRGMRRRIAEHMRHSLDTAAHFTFVAEADFTALVLHREAMRPLATTAGVKLTYLAYVMRALPAALARFPLLNASLDDATHEIVLRKRVHLGLATMTDDGLTVPVIRDAVTLGLFDLARSIERLAGAARAGRLTLEELQGGTFTVTSTGARGGLLATPILHHPQVAILGVHEVRKKPAVVDGAIVARDLTNLSLTLDHRVVDGAVGADFLYALIAALEHPQEWITDADLI